MTTSSIQNKSVKTMKNPFNNPLIRASSLLCVLGIVATPSFAYSYCNPSTADDTWTPDTFVGCGGGGGTGTCAATGGCERSFHRTAYSDCKTVLTCRFCDAGTAPTSIYTYTGKCVLTGATTLGAPRVCECSGPFARPIATGTKQISKCSDYSPC